MIKKLVNPLLLLPLVIFLSSYTCIFGRKEGLKGNIYRVQGNQMPAPGEPSTRPQPFQTTLYIYELTNASQVKNAAQASFYTAINTKFIKEVRSDKKGAFKIKLPPGQYSLFVKKDNLFYANVYDDKNNIAPVAVIKGQYTIVEVKADYGAIY
ncbi:carboxypeptidase regulatory-like domain-containing protein [Paraflavitalea soli]|uniref:Carboxypeptidase regulatory-like domain-containing protein n=1 Tax=Paraflavitalea soli TaxID=2315862 RepID=A0A3B7MQZ3_9BACT|nr:carboxypeptidase regulatory-like domain-containing protein [Paraflavitalea soli]AXY76964.1 carboxypeptidase regulatory-like domain-containing protein [Paraflavitalea soli]